MRKQKVALFMGIILLLEAVCPVAALASDPPYGEDSLAYIYPTVEVNLTRGEMLTDEMRYVNHFFEPDDAVYSTAGEYLKKWLDMSPPSDGVRYGSGYLMLESEYEYQQEFWQQVGYGYSWLVEKVTATVGACGINLIVDAGNHVVHMAKFGRAGAYAQPYYDMLTQTYMSYIEEINNELQDVNDALDIVCDGLEASYDIATKIIDYNDTKTSTISVVNKKTGGNTYTLEIQGFVNGKGSANVRKMTEFSYKINGSKELYTATLSDLAFGKDSYEFELKNLGKEQLSDLKESLRADKAYIEHCFGNKNKRNWARDVNIKAFKGSVEQLVSKDSKAKLTTREREVLQEAADSRETLLNPSREKLTSWGKYLNVGEDFISAVASAATLATTVENATARQTLYANAFSRVTKEQQDMLWSWHDAIQNDAQIENQKEKDCIEGAIYALACDVMLSHDKLKQQVMKNLNVILESTEAIINVASDTSEFFASISALLGKECKELFGNTKLTQLGTLKNVGGGGIMIAASLTNAILNFVGAQNYFDLREKTKVIYNLKKFYSDHTLKLLDAYATNRNRAAAVEIINNLYMVRQLKLLGEDFISMLCISADLEKQILKRCDELDDLPPEVTAILWNEIKLRNSFDINESARSHCTPVWGIFEASDKPDDVAWWRERRLYTPIGYYNYSTEKDLLKWPNAIYQNTALNPVPAEFENVQKDHLFSLDPQKYTYVTYTTVRDNSWLTGDIPTYSDISHLYKQRVYLYQRDGLEVFIPEYIYEKYYIPAQRIVDELLNEYSENHNNLDPMDHQLEERMMLMNHTRSYIDAVDMYDRWLAKQQNH